MCALLWPNERETEGEQRERKGEREEGTKWEPAGPGDFKFRFQDSDATRKRGPRENEWSAPPVSESAMRRHIV